MQAGIAVKHHMEATYIFFGTFGSSYGSFVHVSVSAFCAMFAMGFSGTDH